MPQTDRYEKQFLQALKDIFVGATVEGDSGFINLMKIKSRYFSEGVFPRLMKDIETACKPFEKSFREELFDKLYDFFKRYFSESGSIYFRNTPLHHNVYEKVYTDDRDVMLFWKTHMLYYVKTDRLFKNMEVEVEGNRFFFDVSTLEHKRTNEKRELIYAFKGYREGKILLTVSYSERGRKTKSEEILRALKEKGIVLDEEFLRHAIRIFEKQNEVDYFINKNAKAFLKEQFDLWLYQYVFSGESEWSETRLKQLQVIKTIAYNIIDFIAQFEDELVRVWNKPKFVLNSHYIITLDKISDPQLLNKIFAHPGIKAQLREWQELGMVDSHFRPERILEKDLVGAPLHPQYRYLPLDTRYFSDLELEILALFEDLDSALDGWSVHSENYQALNTLLPKFREKVKAIYIDPPYNTGEDEFLYHDQFQDAGWLTMIHNRLSIARDYLNYGGAIFVQIGDEEQANLKSLMGIVFGENNFRNAIIVRRGIKNVQSQFKDISALSIGHDTLLMFSKNEKARYPKLFEVLAEGEPGKWDTFWRGTDRPTMRYELFGKKPESGQWRWSEDRALLAKKNYEDYLKNHAKTKTLDEYYLGHLSDTGEEIGFIRLNDEDVIQYYVPPRNYKLLSDVWMDVRTRGSVTEFPTEKHTELIETLTKWIIKANELVLDFFSGSGTTAHAIINLNREDGGKRKYILVEMGDYFHTVILPRIKKVVFSEKWKDGKAVEGGKGVSHFAKYYQLEQYEETLRRARYEKDTPLLAGADPYHSYVFLRDLKLLEAVSLHKEQNRVEVQLEKLYEGIDLAETLSCVTGKGIKRISEDAVEFQDGSSASLRNPDWALIKPLIWW